MDCDESEGPPKKMAKLDEKEKKSIFFWPDMMGGVVDRWLDDVTNFKKDNKPCRSSFPESRTFALTKILNDDAVSDWPPQIHNSVNSKCQRVVELCVRHLDEDQLPVLDLLALIFDPNNKFHTFNATRMPEAVEKLYARPPADPQNPQGCLVDLINKFGNLGGFLVLLTRFQPGRRSLTIQMIYALLRPFEFCHELLTVDTIVKYFMPIIERVPVILDALTDEELEEEAKIPLINQHVSATIDIMKSLVFRVPDEEKIVQNLESLRMRTIFKLLLAVGDIDELLAKFNSYFIVDDWNELLELVETNWKAANDKIRRKMLQLLEQSAKDYQPDAMVQRVSELLWDLAYSDEVSTEIMEEALCTHVQVLASFSPQDRDDKVSVWFGKCVDKLKSDDKWTVPALKHISEICEFPWLRLSNQLDIRDDRIISHLENQHSLITVITNNLMNYMNKMRQLVEENPELDETLKPDGRYNHEEQLQERLDALKLLVRIVNLAAGSEQPKQIWQSLVKQSIFFCDRELCFDFFYEVVGVVHPYLAPADIKDLFEQNVLKFNPTMLTEAAMLCFQNVFDAVNCDLDDKLKLDDFIGIDYLWKVVTNSEENIARDAFSILEYTNEQLGSKLKLSDSKIRRTFVAECTKRLLVHTDTLSSLMGIENTAEEENDLETNEKIAIESQKMDRIMKFLRKFIKDCSWEEESFPFIME